MVPVVCSWSCKDNHMLGTVRPMSGLMASVRECVDLCSRMEDLDFGTEYLGRGKSRGVGLAAFSILLFQGVDINKYRCSTYSCVIPCALTPNQNLSSAFRSVFGLCRRLMFSGVSLRGAGFVFIKRSLSTRNPPKPCSLQDMCKYTHRDGSAFNLSTC